MSATPTVSATPDAPPASSPLPTSTHVYPQPPPATGARGAPYRGAGPSPWVYRAPPRLRPASARELAAAFGCAAVFDLALYDGAGGLGLALLFTALPLLTLSVARGRRTSSTTFALGSMLAFTAARCAFSPNAPTVLVGVALVLAFGAALHMRASLFDVALALPLAFAPKKIAAFTAGLGQHAARVRLGRAAVVPIVVPALLVGVFTLVFAAANPVVAHLVDGATRLLGRIVTLPPASRLALIAFALLVSPAILRPAALRRAIILAAPTEAPAHKTTLAVAHNALVGLNALFFLYNALDATTLWAGRPPAGVDLQAYAHQGAAWLTVALLLTTIVLGVMFRGALAHDARAKRTRGLAYVWVAQSMLLALGTYGRIAMHIRSSGLSDLRIVGVLGTSLVVAGLVLVAMKLRSGRSLAWLVRRQFSAFAVAWMAWAIAPTHLISAKIDVARIEAGELRPLVHMRELSREAESTHALLPLLHHPDARVREGVAALLTGAQQRMHARRERQGTWAARDLATGRAARALDGARPRMAEVLRGVDAGEALRTIDRLSGAANYGTDLDVRAVTRAGASE